MIEQPINSLWIQNMQNIALNDDGDSICPHAWTKSIKKIKISRAKKCYLVKIFLGVWCRTLWTCLWWDFLTTFLGWFFWNMFRSETFFGKLVSKLKGWYIQENFVKGNIFKKKYFRTDIFLKDKKVIYGKIFFGKEEEAI